MSKYKYKAFFSYSWKNIEYVDKVDKILHDYGIYAQRDIRDIDYNQSINAFMDKIRESNYAIIMISDDYLKSYFCMKEILELSKERDYAERILPIVLEDADIFNPIGRSKYIIYWQDELDKIVKEIKKIDVTNLPDENIAKTIKLIAIHIGDFINFISDLKIMHFDEIAQTNFRPLVNSLGGSNVLLEKLFDKIDWENFEKSLGNVNEFLAEYPKFAPGYIVQAEMLMQMSETERALSSLEKAIDVDKDFATPYFNLGNYYTHIGNSKKGIDLLTKAIELEPNYYEAYVCRSDSYKKDKNYDAAIEDLRIAIEFNYDLVRCYIKRGYCHLEKGDYLSGILDSNKAIELNPENHSSYTLKGICYNNNSEHKKALVNFERAIELNDKDGEVYHLACVSYLNLKQYDMAEKMLKEAISLDGRYKETYIKIAYSFYEKKDYKQAIYYFTEALKTAPEWAEFILINRGGLYYFENQIDLALKDYSNAININPNCKEAYDNRGVLFSKLGNYDKAIFDLNNSIEIDPDYANAHYNIACVYARHEKDVNLSINALDTCFRLDKKYIDTAKNDSELLVLREHYLYKKLLEKHNAD